MSQLETLATPEERINTAVTFIAYIALLATIGLCHVRCLKEQLSWKPGIPWAAMVGGSQIFMNFLILLRYR